MVGRRAPAVVADVDDQPVLPRADRVKLLLEAMEAGEIHAADVEVAQAALRGFVHRLAAILDELLVKQLVQGGVRDWPQGDGPLLARRVADDQFHVAIDRPVQDPGQVHRGVNRRAVDAQEDIAGLDLALLVVRRAVEDHILDLEPRALIFGGESQAQVGRDHVPFRGRRRRAGSRSRSRGDPSRSGREAQVRAVQFAEHQIHDGGQPVGIGRLGRGVGILAADRVPVAVPELFIVEAIAHVPPRQLERRAIFLRQIDFLPGPDPKNPVAPRGFAASRGRSRRTGCGRRRTSASTTREACGRAGRQSHDEIPRLQPPGLRERQGPERLGLQVIGDLDREQAGAAVDRGRERELLRVGRPEQVVLGHVGERYVADPLMDPVEIDHDLRRLLVGLLRLVVLPGLVVLLLLVRLPRGALSCGPW